MARDRFSEYMPRDRSREDFSRDFYPISTTPLPRNELETIRNSADASPVPNGVPSVLYKVQRLQSTPQIHVGRTSYSPSSNVASNTTRGNDIRERDDRECKRRLQNSPGN